MTDSYRVVRIEKRGAKNPGTDDFSLLNAERGLSLELSAGLVKGHMVGNPKAIAAAAGPDYENGLWIFEEDSNHDVWYAEALAAEKADKVYKGGRVYEDKQDAQK